MPSHQAPQGLYDPAFEHDACGVGMVCHLHEGPSHRRVQEGLEILRNLAHRGACGCDPETGDGAGIMLQLPHAFFAATVGFPLPPPGDYGAGLVFLPTDPDEIRACQKRVQEIVAAEGQVVLGWRRVPVDPEQVGPVARRAMPSFWQLFVGRGPGVPRAAARNRDVFERKLYVIRKQLSHALWASPLAERDKVYVTSLSTRTLIYKGMLTPAQLGPFFPDLSHPALASRMALVHARFSTNTLPCWSLAQPFRLLSHNGEINTLRGNVNWMRARQGQFRCDRFGGDLPKLLPLLAPGGSDSQILDNALELLYFSGRSLPEALMMMMPEAWEHDPEMPAARRAFYEYHACFMEPWDGPATVPFSDGRYLGAVLDRNGLRPSRYTVTHDGLVVLASEAGVLPIAADAVKEKGRLRPGRMFLVDLEEHRIVSDAEIKDRVSRRRPYRQWLAAHLVQMEDLPAGTPEAAPSPDPEALRARQRLFGYTREDLKIVLPPMAADGKEALGSMGDDTPLAVLSDQPRLLYDYFRQLFAQVTNPPLDAIREELVTSLYTYLGAEGELFHEGPVHARRIRLRQPLLTGADLARLDALEAPAFRSQRLAATFDGRHLDAALARLCTEAEQAVDEGHTSLLLSDREAGSDALPIPALLATAAVHHHLIRTEKRMRCALVVESGEPREVHHFALLLGYGANAVHPYLALETVRTGFASGEAGAPDEAVARYVAAVGQGLLKVMSKMGISTLAGYRGAQVFEAVGIGRAMIEAHFTGTSSRLGGIGLEQVAADVRARHAQAYPAASDALPGTAPDGLATGGRYQWRPDGEHHTFNPATVAHLRQAARTGQAASYEAFAALINAQNQTLATLRGLLDFDAPASPVPLGEVAPWTEIVKRFKTGAMSFGSISAEAHETLAVAMNRLGGKSNTGEGGEPVARHARDDERRSRIKQVASGRFGVTIDYLTSADEIQIKMAQGAKPGEGGQLPAQKVFPWIAETRHATPYVGLISPPPHHDIYSIEDLAQLIHDLKNANPAARVCVKLVSEVGVGTIAAGVAKGKADVVLVSGSDGGTGASPQTSILHAGLPWELGLAETHQTLVRNGLRSRIVVECDGQLRTGRDVAVAALLGADEFGFATAPLVALGCIMMRKCHLNTCPVGIATQDPALRAKFDGTPEHVINYFHFVAEELRGLMARLGFRTLAEMTGRVDRLKVREDRSAHPKARHLDLAPLLYRAEVPEHLAVFEAGSQDHRLDDALHARLLAAAQPALDDGRPVRLAVAVDNTNRSFGTRLSHEIARRHRQGLPTDTLIVDAEGVGGQSFGAFGARGLTLRLHGEANDYFGKGLSGAHLILTPPEAAGFEPHAHLIVGNVALYGATSGEVYIHGQAGERFAVRNSGARAVVEGVGDHGCEYMTGGRVVVLGPTGRNFAAGMSGGVAYVYDPAGAFPAHRCNREMVDLVALAAADEAEVKTLMSAHLRHTGSPVAARLLDGWAQARRAFVKVIPYEYRRALEQLARERQDAAAVVAV